MKNTLISIVVVIVVLFAAVYFLASREAGRQPSGPEQTESVAVPEPQAEPAATAAEQAEPDIRYPIAEVKVDASARKMPVPDEEEPLPALDESDEPIREAVSELTTSSRLDELVVFDSVIRHFVVTVDNMTRKKLPQKYRVAREVPGKFQVKKTDDPERFVLDPDNYERYNAYVDFLEVVDLRSLAQIYIHFYPLFQQAYEELGYPDGYFNDRLIEVIDQLLATPQVHGEVKLVRPKVFYEFADPDLERLSVGQKALIRMGPINAERVKARLEDLRRMLVTGGL